MAAAISRAIPSSALLHCQKITPRDTSDVTLFAWVGAQTPAAADGPNVPAGSVPQKPSQGAVTGAIGAVLPSARVCLGPDDPVSHASIVFGSDGHVQTVTVTGAAQGKMAEGCIKDALMKAKVGPFAEPSYSTRITIRHQ